MKTIEVHYKIHLSDKDFNRLLKKSEESGYDYNDAGKMESVRRLLESEGFYCDAELFVGPEMAKVEQLIVRNG